MAAKFTPGPWKYVATSDSQLIQQTRTDLLVAEVAQDETYDEAADVAEAEANAHLIAAAPELFEALTKILKHVEDMELERKGNQCTLCHTYRMIGHAALAKAEGRQA
jgi:predicted adenine nucleotide alpha hydrolase (AANH) superfamily ATPase